MFDRLPGEFARDIVGEDEIRIREVSGRRGALFKRGASDLKTEKRGSNRRTMMSVHGRKKNGFQSVGGRPKWK